MDEVRASPLSGLKAISTFSGAGGSSLGLRMAGYEVLWASEFVEAARETYRANFPTTVIDERDIRTVEAGDILATIGLDAGELDLMDGSPPCAGFSTAGKRQKGWGQVKAYSDTEQVVDDLFFEFARLLEGIRPRAFLAENVPGLTIGKAKGYFKQIHARLRAAGYRVEARIVDASWLGVPQTRRRLFFQGIREDLGLTPAWPPPLDYRYSVRDAIGDLIGKSRVHHDTSGWREFCRGEITDRPAPAIMTSHTYFQVESEGVEHVPGCAGIHEPPVDFGIVSGGSGHRFVGKSRSVDEPAPTVMADGVGGDAPHQMLIEEPLGDPSIDRYAIGEEWDKLRQGEQSDKYFNLMRTSETKPCPTITQTGGVVGAASVTHPTEKRKFTIAELRRLCSFPDDFVLTGSYRQQWERLGRSVPPLMMAAVSGAVRDRLTEGT